jgi:hypothetical protein
MNSFETEIRSRQEGAFEEMNQVLMIAESLPEEERKKLLRLENTMLGGRGGFRYDLLLGHEEATGEAYLAVKTTSSNDMGVSFDKSQEVAWSWRANRGRTPLRIGYLRIDDQSIRDVRPIKLTECTATAMEDILKLYYPNHRIEIQDVDAHGGF